MAQRGSSHNQRKFSMKKIPLKRQIYIADTDITKRWYPSGPFVKSSRKKDCVERQIMDFICDSRPMALRRAIALIKRGCDYNHLFDLGRVYHYPGRLLKTVMVADGIISGRIEKKDITARIHGLAITAGHRAYKNKSS